MTAREWKAILGAIRERWPHAKASEYPDDLLAFPVEQVQAALDSLYRSGREFPPNAAQIRREIFRLIVDLPEWAEVRRALEQAWRLPTSVWRGRELPPADRRAEALEREHPAIRAFAELLGPAEVERGLSDSTGEAQIRGKWERLVAKAEKDAALVGLPAAEGLRAIERANAGPRPLGATLRAALPAAPFRREL
jgi:hypothetical protein